MKPCRLRRHEQCLERIKETTGHRTRKTRLAATAHRAGDRCASRNGGRLSEGRRNRGASRSEEHTSELQSQSNLVCRLLLEKKKQHRRKWTGPSATRPPAERNRRAPTKDATSASQH